jgi:hypothetical protein
MGWAWLSFRGKDRKRRVKGFFGFFLSESISEPLLVVKMKKGLGIYLWSSLSELYLS